MLRSAYLTSSKRSTFSRFAACEREPRATPQSAAAASSPYILRTDSALRAAPVLRPAYFPKRVHRTLFSKTLDLQSLCGLRKGAEGNPSVCCGSQLSLHSSHRLSSSSCAGVAVGLFSEKSTLYSFLQNARPSAALRPAKGSRGQPLSLLRSQLPLHSSHRRSSSSCAGVAVGLFDFVKTLDLQPLCGLRKGAEGNPSVCCGDNSP